MEQYEANTGLSRAATTRTQDASKERGLLKGFSLLRGFSSRTAAHRSEREAHRSSQDTHTEQEKVNRVAQWLSELPPLEIPHGPPDEPTDAADNRISHQQQHYELPEPSPRQLPPTLSLERGPLVESALPSPHHQPHHQPHNDGVRCASFGTTTLTASAGTGDSEWSLRVGWHEVHVGAILGAGGCGRIYKGRWQGHRVAIKMVERADGKQLARLRHEAIIMSQMRHPCIARVFGLVDEYPKRVAIIMQYYPRGSLQQFMASDVYPGLEPVARLYMAWQVATGMAYLHSRGLYHLDLKTSNLLIGVDGSVVIADFGLARYSLAAAPHQDDSLADTGALSVSIAPPEVLHNPHARRGPAADVFAFGICLLEIITGRPAYSRAASKEEIRAAVCAGRRPEIPGFVHPKVAATIADCWAQDAASRPTFVDVANWLSDVVKEMEPGGDDIMLPGC